VQESYGNWPVDPLYQFFEPLQMISSLIRPAQKSPAPQPEDQTEDPGLCADADVGIIFENKKFFQITLNGEKVEVQPDCAKVLPAEVNNHKVSKKEHPAYWGDDMLPFVPKGRRSNHRPTHGLEASTAPQPSRDLRSSGTSAPATRPKRFVQA
jgi:hypothetical protein